MFKINNRFAKLSILGMVMGVISACGHTPVSSMVKLRNFDPATTDIKQLSVAVVLPHEYRIQQGGVIMTLELRKKDGSQKKMETFSLTTSLSSQDKLMLAKIKEPGRQVIAYRLRPYDIKRFNKIRKFTLEKRPTKLWEGSFNIGASACRLGNNIPKTLPVSIYLKSSETKSFVPFIVNADLVKESDGNKLHETVPPCKSAKVNQPK